MGIQSFFVYKFLWYSVISLFAIFLELKVCSPNLFTGIIPKSELVRNISGNSRQIFKVVTRPRNLTDLRHRRSRRAYRGRKSVREILVRRSRHLQDCRLVVRGVHLPDCRRHQSCAHSSFNKECMAEYPINKGIGRPVEFKGLKAQYLFIFCGGLLALFVLFVILYMVGIDQWICIGFGAGNFNSKICRSE